MYAEYKIALGKTLLTLTDQKNQTVMHFHCHLIPRYKGDMENPRGGVRGVIPEKQKY